MFDPTGTYPCGSQWASDASGNISVTVYDCSYGGSGSDGPTARPMSDSDTPSGSGGGGGGPNSGGSSSAALLGASTGRIEQDLTNPKCASDFKNMAKVDYMLDNISFKDLGPLKFSADRMPLKSSAPVGRSNLFTSAIYLNSEVNWQDPANTQGQFDNQAGTYNALGAEANYLGISSMTSGQFMDIIGLHELLHFTSTIGNPDSQRVEQRLWNDCIH